MTGPVFLYGTVLDGAVEYDDPVGGFDGDGCEELSPPGYSDRCGMPACLRRPPVDENPVRVALVDDWYVANYVCSQCGYEWATSWEAGQYGPASDRRMRRLAEVTRLSGVPMLLPGGRRLPNRKSKMFV